MSARPAIYHRLSTGDHLSQLDRGPRRGPVTPSKHYASWREMYREWARLNPTPRKGGAVRRLIQRFKRAFGVK